ncbi:MAG: lamin tail domain-containing protein, partial [Planctomycetales bacterium]|nr:lamin tail domain-containing protein [Planctomycetales bacterium]
MHLSPEPLQYFQDTVLVSGVAGDTTGTYFVPSDDTLGDTWASPTFDDSAWASGKLGMGFDGGSNVDFDETFIATEVNANATVPGATNFMVRIPFQVNDLDAVKQQALVLRMKYDDGFIAYLNGTQVHVQNVNTTNGISWNTRASASHPDADGKLFEDFDISANADLLVPGNNLLAIRIFNQSAAGNDLMVLPELVARETLFGLSPTASVYYTTDGTDPRGADGNPSASATQLLNGGDVTIDRNVRIIARAFDEADRGKQSAIVRSDWSGPVEYNFSVRSQPFVISEVNYNPSPATDAEKLAGFSSDDFEFIELQFNGITQTDLLGLRLSDGVEFDFYTSNIQSVQPGGRVLVVANEAAFKARYGSGLPVAGEYRGNLDNNGEDIDLKDVTGETIFSVSYGDSDPWPVAADGLGATLVLKDPAHVTDKQQNKWYSWRSSTEYNGTPGAASAAASGVVINEVLTRNDAPSNAKDVVELYNSSA